MHPQLLNSSYRMYLNVNRLRLDLHRGKTSKISLQLAARNVRCDAAFASPRTIHISKFVAAISGVSSCCEIWLAAHSHLIRTSTDNAVYANGVHIRSQYQRINVNGRKNAPIWKNRGAKWWWLCDQFRFAINIWRWPKSHYRTGLHQYRMLSSKVYSARSKGETRLRRISHSRHRLFYVSFAFSWIWKLWYFPEISASIKPSSFYFSLIALILLHWALWSGQSLFWHSAQQ